MSRDEAHPSVRAEILSRINKEHLPLPERRGELWELLQEDPMQILRRRNRFSPEPKKRPRAAYGVKDAAPGQEAVLGENPQVVHELDQNAADTVIAAVREMIVEQMEAAEPNVPRSLALLKGHLDSVEPERIAGGAREAIRFFSVQAVAVEAAREAAARPDPLPEPFTLKLEM